MTENRLDDREGTQADGRSLPEDEPQGQPPDETAAAAEGPEDHVDRERQEVDGAGIEIDDQVAGQGP